MTNAPLPLTRTINVPMIKALESQLVSWPAGEKTRLYVTAPAREQPDKDVHAQRNPQKSRKTRTKCSK